MTVKVTGPGRSGLSRSETHGILAGGANPSVPSRRLVDLGVAPLRRGRTGGRRHRAARQPRCQGRDALLLLVQVARRALQGRSRGGRRSLQPLQGPEARRLPRSGVAPLAVPGHGGVRHRLRAPGLLGCSGSLRSSGHQLRARGAGADGGGASATREAEGEVGSPRSLLRHRGVAQRRARCAAEEGETGPANRRRKEALRRRDRQLLREDPEAVLGARARSRARRVVRERLRLGLGRDARLGRAGCVREAFRRREDLPRRRRELGSDWPGPADRLGSGDRRAEDLPRRRRARPRLRRLALSAAQRADPAPRRGSLLRLVLAPGDRGAAGARHSRDLERDARRVGDLRVEGARKEVPRPHADVDRSVAIG